MASESNDRRTLIAILLTSTLLTMLGIAGVYGGTLDLRSAPLPEDLESLFTEETDSERDAKERELRVQLLEAQATNPYKRPIAAANVVVSALVLIGSFMLSWRRKIAQWWIKQAVAAKLIWIVAYTATLVHHLRIEFPTLPKSDATGTTLNELVSYIVMGSLVSAALHVWAAWRALRPDVRAFIEASNKA